MSELYLIYILIIVSLLLLTAVSYYFYNKFYNIENELSYVKKTFDEMDDKSETSSNNDEDHYMTSDDEEEGHSMNNFNHEEQLKLAEEFYKAMEASQKHSEESQENEPSTRIFEEDE
jgi:uncharacterized protein YxeA